MTHYRIRQSAKEDLWELYAYGVQQLSEKQADIYLEGIFARFEAIAHNPHLYPKVDDIRKGYFRTIADDGVVEIAAIIGRQNKLP